MIVQTHPEWSVFCLLSSIGDVRGVLKKECTARLKYEDRGHQSRAWRSEAKPCTNGHSGTRSHLNTAPKWLARGNLGKRIRNRPSVTTQAGRDDDIVDAQSRELEGFRGSFWKRHMSAEPRNWR